MGFGLGAMGATRRGGFGSGGALGRAGTSGPVMPGKATLNIGGNDLNASTFINILKAGLYNFNNKADAGKMDSDGYIISAPAATVFLAWPPNATFNPGVTYKLAWPASRSTWTWTFVGSTTKVSTSGAGSVTVTGGAGSNMTVTPVAGQAGWVTFTTTVDNFTINIGINGQTYAAGSGEIALYRLSDEADYLAGEYFTPEYKALISALRPFALRFMGWMQSGNANLNFETTWAYRLKLSNLTWSSAHFHPNAWGGTVSGTDTYTIAPAPGSPADWTDGEVIQGFVTNANTSTTPTLTITGHTGAKTIVRQSSGTMTVGFLTANTATTFIYDKVLDKVLSYPGPGGLATSPPYSVPIEAMAQLCNRVRSNMWANVPPMATDDYVTQWATAALNNLATDLYFYPEYSNEIWNNVFPQNGWAQNRGLALGFTSASNRHYHGYYGLRVRQIMGDLIPPVWSSRASKLRRTLMFQGAGDVTTRDYRMKGADLAPTGTSTGTGNAAYIAFTDPIGGVGKDYTTKPNRPIDVVETIGYAPYAGGTNLYFGSDINANDIPNSTNAIFYQALVNAWDGGDSVTSIAMIDADIRGGLNSVQTVTWDSGNSRWQTPAAHGFVANKSDVAFTVSGGTSYSGLTPNAVYQVNSTPTSNTFTMRAYGTQNAPAGSNITGGTPGTGTVSVGWMGGQGNSSSSTAADNVQTMQKACSNWYVFGEWLAAQFDADRPSGAAALRVEQYEGSLELLGPSAAQLTTLGVTGTNPKASIDAAVEAWKNSSLARATIAVYYRQFMGLDATMPTYQQQLHSIAPAHLVLQGSTLWGLQQGKIPAGTPYQLYNGFKDYSTS